MLTACASFIKDEDFLHLKDYENNLYILQKDVGEGDNSLKRGQRVKLYVKVGDDSIKIYCYPADTAFLKSNRVLILYNFEDDYKDSKFDKNVFNERLFTIITHPKK